MTRSSRTYIAVIGGVFACLLFFSQAQAETGASLSSAETLDTPSLMRELNEDRIAAGLHPLRRDESLDIAAGFKASDMVKNQYFAHTSPSGITPWHWFTQASYNYDYAGENLAIQFATAEEVQQAWMNSPKHRENILNPHYEDVGYAIATGTFKEEGSQKSRTGTIVVQVFGKRTALASRSVEPLISPAVLGEIVQKNNRFALLGVSDVVSLITQNLVLNPTTNPTEGTRIAQTSFVQGHEPSEDIPPTTWPALALSFTSLMVGAGLHTRLVI